MVRMGQHRTWGAALQKSSNHLAVIHPESPKLPARLAIREEDCPSSVDPIELPAQVENAAVEIWKVIVLVLAVGLQQLAHCVCSCLATVDHVLLPGDLAGELERESSHVTHSIHVGVAALQGAGGEGFNVCLMPQLMLA